MNLTEWLPTGVENFQKELSWLKKENTVLVCKLDQTKSDKKALQKELRNERKKKKDITTITLSDEQEQLLSTLLPASIFGTCCKTLYSFVCLCRLQFSMHS